MGEQVRYDPNQYDRPSVTTDTVVLALRQDTLQVLLVRRRNWPYQGMWAIPGGFVEMDESLEAAARRELGEETGLADPAMPLEQLHAFGAPGRDPRMRVITIAFLALVGAEQVDLRPATDAADAAWFPAYDPPPLAFDHDQILSCATAELCHKVEHTPAIFQLLPETFTLTELQDAYEQVLRRELDKRNFRRKMLSTGLLVETPHVRSGDHRPAKLYCFRGEAAIEATPHPYP
ncbi:MAG: NUDIX hydrolase [Anaerolineae bacterium]|nr:NUDIX hydrolase [Anaerolineae bacterium]